MTIVTKQYYDEQDQTFVSNIDSLDLSDPRYVIYTVTTDELPSDFNPFEEVAITESVIDTEAKTYTISLVQRRGRPDNVGFKNAIKNNPNFNDWFNLLSSFSQLELFKEIERGIDINAAFNDANQSVPIPANVLTVLANAGNANNIDISIP